jgi:tRNA A37 threonylcarbamoyltransferase TsaD
MSDQENIQINADIHNLELYSDNYPFRLSLRIKNFQDQSEFKKLPQKVLIPEMDLATDNAVMIAVASFIQSFYKKAEINPDIKADGNLSL